MFIQRVTKIDNYGSCADPVYEFVVYVKGFYTSQMYVRSDGFLLWEPNDKTASRTTLPTPLPTQVIILYENSVVPHCHNAIALVIQLLQTYGTCWFQIENYRNQKNQRTEVQFELCRYKTLRLFNNISRCYIDPFCLLSYGVSIENTKQTNPSDTMNEHEKKNVENYIEHCLTLLPDPPK